MKICMTIAAFFLTASLVCAQEKEAFMANGDGLWLKRSESIDNVRQAIELWQKAGEKDPKDATPLYQISMGYYFLGRFSEGDETFKKDLFTKGKEWGEKAVAVDPQSAGAHYFLAVNMAKWGEAHGKVKSLFLSKDLIGNLSKAKDIDPTFYYGGADRVLGKVLFEVPGVFGGDKKRAEEHLRASLKIAPNYGLTLLYLAELLIDANRKEEAKGILDKLATLQPMPGFEQELKDDQDNGNKLRQKLK